MEIAKKTKRATKKSTASNPKGKIEAAYLNHLLTEGKQPASIYKFCLDLGMDEATFYDHFGSFESIERGVWKQWIDTTLARLLADESYGAFSAKEKILAFYFTLFEELRRNRSFVLMQLKHAKRLDFDPPFLRDFKRSFEDFFERTLSEGKGRGEVANRPFLDQRYPKLFWFHFGFLIMFWKDDTSTGLEHTDAAIEKSVTLAFDLISKGATDSAIDLAKFLYQSKK
jgi:AcrR family transcriptional regulator